MGKGSRCCATPLVIMRLVGSRSASFLGRADTCHGIFVVPLLVGKKFCPLGDDVE